ncbi:cryptochrome/photolyase family protein [Longispora albida]|uniref:cryptochrome/photolyase family protein n=1 Tax=Longispora albida TaxID=203523 RepID=UPI00058B18C5|nr:deoxyribodipyrimidine photo-lyase [Longispora albida]
MRTIVVLFTRDLRVHDNPALHAACRVADQVIPLFVHDGEIRVSPIRRDFLTRCLAGLRGSLRALGGDLIIRYGDPVAEALRLAAEHHAEGIGLAADVSRYAARRQARLLAEGERHRLAVRLFDGVTVVPPGALRPSGGGSHYKVFTPYWRTWQEYPRRAELPPPDRVTLPPGIEPGELEARPGDGEPAALDALECWLSRVDGYGDTHDELANAGGTSRLSAYLHLGCLSPLVLANATAHAEPYVRQLCWRDFYQQVLAGFPGLPDKAYRPGAADDWADDPVALAAWQEGRTGVPVVDAGMRQLQAEGFMHNRARMITASYLTKQLGLDWRAGAAWFDRWLLDADVANNYGNWQWVAGTGNDSKPYRRFNPDRQASRFDPDGTYIERWAPELLSAQRKRWAESKIRPTRAAG